MVQGGYVSQSSSKTLTVSKKSNVLDKKPPKTSSSSPLNSSNNNNTSDYTAAAPSIDVSIYKHIYISPPSPYPHNHMLFFYLQESVLKDLQDELKRQNDEMRKLKAIIVKHENRIRSLEAAQKTREDDVLDSILYNTSAAEKSDVSDITKTPSAGNLAPDEV